MLHLVCVHRLPKVPWRKQKRKEKRGLAKEEKRKPDAMAPDESEQTNLRSHGACGAAVMQCRAFRSGQIERCQGFAHSNC